jgi:hypothetical protein
LPERPEHVVEHRAGRHPHAHALQVGGNHDRLGDRGDLPHAVVEGAHREAVDALGRHFGEDVRAERTIDGLVGLWRGAEGEGHLLNLCHRHRGAQYAAHQREELNLARHQHLERRRVAPGHVVVEREDLRVNASARLGANRGPHLREPLVERAVGRLVVVLREGELGAALRSRACSDEQGSRASSRTGQERTSREWFWHGWRIVSGLWSLVSGLWSLVSRLWSLVMTKD